MDKERIFLRFEEMMVDYIHDVMYRHFDGQFDHIQEMHMVVGACEILDTYLTRIGIDKSLYFDSEDVRNHMNMIGITCVLEDDLDETSILH